MAPLVKPSGRRVGEHRSHASKRQRRDPVGELSGNRVLNGHVRAVTTSGPQALPRQQCFAAIRYES